MGLKSDIESALKDAIKTRDEASVRALRMLKTALKHAEVEKGRELEDGEIQDLIRKLIRQRKESIEAFQEGGRSDLVEKESAEIKVLERFIPPEMSDDEIREFLKVVIKKVGATEVSHVGKVMKEAMKELKGKADGKRVNELALELLKGER